jgi:Plant self-incompatibility protein S1
MTYECTQSDKDIVNDLENEVNSGWVFNVMNNMNGEEWDCILNQYKKDGQHSDEIKVFDKNRLEFNNIAGYDQPARDQPAHGQPARKP